MNIRDFKICQLFLLALVTVDAAPAPVHAEISLEAAASFCPTRVSITIDSVRDYLLSFSDALARAKEGRGYVLQIPATKANPDGTFLLLKKAQQQYACAIKQIIQYQRSRNEDIKGSATGASNAFNALYAVVGALSDDYRNTLDGKNANLPAGTYAERRADLSMAMDESWKKLLAAGILTEYASLDPNRKGYLILTAKDRADVVRTLKAVAGRQRGKDTPALEFTARSLVQFFEKKEWKSATSNAIADLPEFTRPSGAPEPEAPSPVGSAP